MQHLITRAVVLLAVLGVGVGLQQRLDTPEPTWDPVLEPYVAFVEETRQLEFTEPVTLVRTDVSAELSDLNDEYEAQLPASELGYDPHAEATRLLGLTGPVENLGSAQADVVEQGAAAFYDSYEKTIVLPPGPVDAALELTIVHELTHALQDQHGLLVYSEVESWTSADLRRALIEGDASLVEYEWFDALSAAEQQAIEEHSQEAGEPPDGFLQSYFASAYALGPPIVESIIDEGGFEQLNLALRRKSLGSDEQLIDPLSASPTPNGNAGLEMVDPDGNEWFDGWIGAFGWYHALAPSVGPETALIAIQGYSDDAFVTFEQDGAVCARFDVWFDTRNDAAEFADALVPWGVIHHTINPDRRTVRVDLCESVGDPNEQSFDLMTPLVVNSWMAVEHLAHTESVEVARCAALAQAVDVGFAEPGSIDWDQLETNGAAARALCTNPPS